MPAWSAFACPTCHANLEHRNPALGQSPELTDELFCAAEGLSFQRSGGIWRFISTERATHYHQFKVEYENIRLAEGRGSRDASYYRALPRQDLSGSMSVDWQIRATSFDTMLQQVVMPLEANGRSLAILDLGAGNGWLSNHLAKRGHQVAAVDLLDNDFDGLACAQYFQTEFTPVQAEFDLLPFPNNTADLVIFNASLHYSTNIQASLVEALRVLRATGKLIILDSPVYHTGSSGQKMVQERETHFQERFGFPSNTLQSENYLTYQLLKTLAAPLALQWKFITPFYGLRWMLRPLKAWLRANREPAKFHIIVGSR
ncbi:MAG: class I SAM-dependent methyltransferase [Chloroflexi bacterium]|nr:class I SAM-dependent methyltransferase [Chloroflexota bacterium]